MKTTKKQLLDLLADMRKDRIDLLKRAQDAERKLWTAEDKLRDYTRVLRPAVALHEWIGSTFGDDEESFREEHPHYAKTRELRIQQFAAQLAAEIHILGYGYCEEDEEGHGRNVLPPPADDSAHADV